MPRIALNGLQLERGHLTGFPRAIRRVLFGLFLIQFAAVVAAFFPGGALFGAARWPDGLLVVLATATTLGSLTRQLPAQNVILASIIIAVIAGAAHSLGALTGIPFGPYVYTERIGQQLFHPLPWAVPMIWIVAVVNSRGVARLILRPWRKTRNYGFWLIGLTVFLVLLFEVAFEPFATQVRGYWQWQPTKIPLNWYSAPVSNFVGWLVTALLILAFGSPALINKKPVKFPPDYSPLAVWLLLNLFFLVGVAQRQLWAAAIATLAQTLLVAAFAIAGPRRERT